MDTDQLVALDKRHLWHPFTPMRLWLDGDPLIIERAEGNELIDTKGRRYLDGVSSLWCNVHGHRHPALDQAIRDQLDRVAHTTLLGLGSVPAIELAEQLVKLAPAGLTRVFYSDSGSTAVEIALKLAFQAQQLRGQPERQRFLVLDNAYHGDTVGAVSLGGIDLFHQIFQPLLFHTERIPPTISALEVAFAQHGSQLAAFVVEPLIQGAAGMLVQPTGFLRRARQLCDAHGVLLICDEVATGFGRTGRMFASEHEAVSPDLMCVAKGITGGYLPLAATLTTEALFETFLGAPAERRTFFHGHTYTGNALACAVALASVALFESEQVLPRVQSNAGHLAAQLAKRISPLAAVREIRQRGYMIGIELHALVPEPVPELVPEPVPFSPERTATRPVAAKPKAAAPAVPARPLGAEVCMAVRRRGAILRPLGNVVVLMPPLSFHVEQLDQLVEWTREAILEVCGP